MSIDFSHFSIVFLWNFKKPPVSLPSFFGKYNSFRSRVRFPTQNTEENRFLFFGNGSLFLLIVF